MKVQLLAAKIAALKARVECFAAWDESKHPRASAGSDGGGRFIATNEGMMKGKWKVKDTHTGETRVVTDTKAGAISEANILNSRSSKAIQDFLKSVEGKGLSPEIIAAAVTALKSNIKD